MRRCLGSQPPGQRPFSRRPVCATNIANLAKLKYNETMRSVNIGALKNQLSSYLRYVRKGEEVVIHDRDKPVAKIIPFNAPEVTDEEAHLARIGVLKLPEHEMDWVAFWKLPRPIVSKEASQEAIQWAKGDR